MYVTSEARQPELRDIVVEASRALAHLDADRLEELASSCQALNRELPSATGLGKPEMLRQARAAQTDMETFARVLDATRANLDVIRRLREIRMGRRGYAEDATGGWTELENAHGHD
jgi:hypothetical protein